MRPAWVGILKYTPKKICTEPRLWLHLVLEIFWYQEEHLKKSFKEK